MEIKETYIAYVPESNSAFTGKTDGYFIKVYHCIRPSQFTSFHYYFKETKTGKLENITKENFEELISNTFKKAE